MKILIAVLSALLLWPAALGTALAADERAADTPLLLLEPVAGGLDVPVYVTGAGDGSGRLFIVERGGLIRVVDHGQLLPEPFLDLRGIAYTDDDKMGLLGLAFNPDFPHEVTFYVTYTGADRTNYLMHYHVSEDNPNRADPSTAEVVLAIPDTIKDHNLGMITYGPDGYLYLSTGDEGGNGDPLGRAQDLGSLWGKVLRIDVHGSVDPYGIPEDNPFVDVPGVRAEIWASGLRSPWRFSFDRVTGDLFIGDVGESSWEEVNYQPAASTGGENYGWNRVEGPVCFPAGSSCDLSAYTAPIHTYSHDSGCAVTGGYVYRGSSAPALYGKYVFADFCSGRISALRQTTSGAWARSELLDTDLLISSFGEGDDGELYLTDMRNGMLLRLVEVDAYPTPVVTALSPGSSPAGGSGMQIDVQGSGFAPEAVVLWNGSPRPTTWTHSGLLQATLSESDLMTIGNAEVRVRNPAPGGGESNAAVFSVGAPGFASDAFAGVWTRADAPVAGGAVSRTWLWGPEPFTDKLYEPYAEAPDGMRVVQYFDKARMELTHPDADPNAEWYVTTGLLVVELVTGRVQVGDNAWQTTAPAQVNVAGDPDDPNGPSYATIGRVLDAPAAALGTPITQRLARDGRVTDDPVLAARGVTAATVDPFTNHSIASVFWDALNAGESTEASALGGIYAVGRPIAEPYWATVQVAGTPHDVLLQCFERRCLTYTPENAPGWQVEAGNVGRHYFRWRY